ncbi:MAG: hypothetical protein FWH51_03790 [Dehalococcoidia bacterium]|nr:hypothetical protein [Dehalococcoidia bacterium]
MNRATILTQLKKTAFNAKIYLEDAPPRIQLFFVANLLKLAGAVAIGLASFLNFQSLGALTGPIIFLWLCSMLAVATPQVDAWLTASRRWLKPAYRLSVTTLAIVMSVEILAVSAVMTWSAIDRTSLPPAAQAIKDAFEPSDAIAFNVQAAENLLSGQNPYAHANIITALDASPEAYGEITPLRTGVFADSFPYPTNEELKNLWHGAIANPEVIPPEIESRYNYPAGSFLLLAPFMAIGISDLRLVLLIFLLPILFYAVLRLPSHRRWYLVLGVLLAVELWNALFDGDTKLLCLLPILAGYLMVPRRLWLSAILMGIAAATRQTAWFFLPFYLILIWQTVGWRPALRSGIIIGAVFLIANAPFIAADPTLWISSVTAPMTSEMFPMGAGIITLVTAWGIPLDWPALFTALEIAALAGGILWYLRHAQRYPHAGLILAVIPLFFAWRSLWSYFYFVDIVLLSVILSQKSFQIAEPPPLPEDQSAVAA